jgi:predicted N-acetyltransferase YhbS
VELPFWSLAPIAVLPEERGKGIARELILRKLPEFDAAGLPCFLGTQDRINLTIYGNYGFNLIREDPVAPSEIIHYTMLRKPSPRG